MRTSDFNYSLPDQAISRIPAEPRDSARLLVSRNPSELSDAQISDLPYFLNRGDLIVVNNTKVLPARIPVIRSTGGAGEVFLLHRIDDGVWNALVRPSGKIDVGEIVVAQSSDSDLLIQIEIGVDNGQGHRIVRFIDSDEQTILSCVGQAPLPPYLGKVDIDLERYQTMFALDDKSVAAPTAGLHFTTALVKSLATRGVDICEVTLHVGVGTFRPIMTDHIEDHTMHEEMYYVSKEVWKKIQTTKSTGKKVIAVGTTSLRTIESVALTGLLAGSTSLYCHGNFDFKIADYLFTNFHQPGSSLLVLLDSFIGSRWRELYSHALADNYRFLSFGDAMLVGRRGESI